MQVDEVWEIVLGRKVGPLQLGATLSEVITVLKQRSPVRAFEIEYNEDEPYASDIVINSPDDGFKLQFHSVTQLLTVIDVYQVNNLALRYQSNILCGKDATPTFLSVYQLVGPTYPGTYDPATKLYTLHYVGGSFRFPIPKEFEKLYRNKDVLPLELPNGSTPAAMGLSIYGGNGVPSTNQAIPVPLKQHYYEPVVVDMANMHKLVVTFPTSRREIRIGDTPQEVISALGPPSSTYFKPSLDASSLSTGGEYFHNFADLGIDVMYSAWHAVSKIILRTNLPGHGEFNSYFKCNYQLQHFGATVAATTSSHMTVTPETTWSSMVKALDVSSEALRRPIVYDNGSAKDPFHASRFYAPFDGCLVEVRMMCA
ncbi:hypothetical protein, variant 2 [Aphanomyces astaci]|uniref:Uncharacterized protein n=1 Tax=Aphanomyces astaci TaxID=112090 RepID=W4GPC5_APHAT|nr:hypothetical protein, variant 3 [Aphanomyces astaci]XP_009829431.1 hypothetical protein, variant 2 [Aphanomyces astaci]ETV81570.1 hypothetical protein, variant 2 [Aphanomyces astaci]ETV81571.1 hypothetical protein, variant 3 [Aphanomyces astaci]|eukprot:XP_009829427.1 hypothetical protein, variant 3 [Aphanomyces astaci]